MKKTRARVFIFIMCGLLLKGENIVAQCNPFDPPDTAVIPYGTSIDTMAIMDWNYSTFWCFPIYYYKPLSYDSLTSPILWALHGLGENGGYMISRLSEIADRRKALIVAPTANSWGGSYISPVVGIPHWLPEAFKVFYRQILIREKRDSIPVYLTGFSMGGTVSNYMLIRQAVPDSMPVLMAVSVNPGSYTFCTDTFQGIPMPYTCGINSGFPMDSTILSLINDTCDERIKQYYNENYGVLIGTADTANSITGWACGDIQGANRYERAKNFYNFSDTDAIRRGTMLQWVYGEVPDVGHYGYGMYNTILTGDSVPLAERMLFETPFHTVPDFTPIASFSADTTIVQLPNAIVNFINNSINTTSYLWDFGDSTTSTQQNPQHTYTTPDTFTVTLKAYSTSGCENVVEKKNYIIVKQGSGIDQRSVSSIQIQMYPNPFSQLITLITNNPHPLTENLIFEMHDVLGRKVKQLSITTPLSEIKRHDLLSGIYFYQIKDKSQILFNGKVVIE